MPVTATNMGQKIYIQTLRASFALRTLGDAIDNSTMEEK